MQIADVLKSIQIYLETIYWAWFGRTNCHIDWEWILVTEVNKTKRPLCACKLQYDAVKGLIHAKDQLYPEPKGIDYSADGKQGENPEGTENGGQEELQPRPNAVMKGGVTLGQKQKQLCYWLLR